MQWHGPRKKTIPNFHAWQNLPNEQVCSETSLLIAGNISGVIANADHKSDSLMLEQWAV